jgi:hypothetical protein
LITAVSKEYLNRTVIGRLIPAQIDYGHQAGDDCLKLVADTLAGCAK